MSEILLYYRRPDPTTWVYLSSFLTIGLFFVFHRFWSIRNVDILLLILLAPGLLMVHEGYRRQLIESETLARRKDQRSEDDRPQDQGREALLRTAKLSDAQPVDWRAETVASLVAAVPIFAIAQADAVSEPQDSGSEESVSVDGQPNLRESENTASRKDVDQLGSGTATLRYRRF